MGNTASALKVPRDEQAPSGKAQSPAARAARTISKGFLTNGTAALVALPQVPGLHVLSARECVAADPGKTGAKACPCGPPVNDGDTGASTLAEAMQVGNITSLQPVPGGCDLTWTVDIPQVFGVQDTSRSPCGSNMRLVSPAFALHTLDCPSSPTSVLSAAAPSGPPSTRSSCSSAASTSPNSPSSSSSNGGAHHEGVACHMQQLRVDSGAQGAGSVEWRLIWAMFDHNDSYVSLYLSGLPMSKIHRPQHQQAGPQELMAAPAGTEASSTSSSTAVRCKGCGSSSSSSGSSSTPYIGWQVVVEGWQGGKAVVKYSASVPCHDYHQSGAVWGLQNFLTLAELDLLTSMQQLRLCVHLQLQDGSASVTDAPAANPTGPPPQTHASNTSATDKHSANKHNSMQAVTQFMTPSRHMLSSSSSLPPVVLVSLSPRILLIDNFLDDRLCNELMALATPRLVRSRVSTGMETPSRTSRGTFFTGTSAQHPLLLQVEARISQLMNHAAVIGGKKRLVNSEALQVVAYSTGDFYNEHYDNKAGGYVTRHATILIYLCDCEQGGGTLFPRATAVPTDEDVAANNSTPACVAGISQGLHDDLQAARPGVRILPVKGRAIVFWSALPDGTEDLASLHAAEPVTKGEKWIATRWFKEI